MGLYINFTSDGKPMNSTRKAAQLVADGAKQLPQPKHFQLGLCCVIENGPFDAAAWIYNEKEFDEFSNDNTRRPRTWLRLTDEQLQENISSETLRDLYYSRKA